MNYKYCDSRSPPYKWIQAYYPKSKEYKDVFARFSKYIYLEYPFYTTNNFRLVIIACAFWDIAFEYAILPIMSWKSLSSEIIEKLQHVVDVTKKDYIKPDTLQEVALSFVSKSNYHEYGCIDKLGDTPFEVIPNNVIVYIHQVKRFDKWVFVEFV